MYKVFIQNNSLGEIIEYTTFETSYIVFDLIELNKNGHDFYIHVSEVDTSTLEEVEINGEIFVKMPDDFMS